jgi:alkanesulfonate monooxygenase SsuD/methylene tetrahydromethanopterin reductase-like flavin-dependent oxidoreductase (luciferase family)
MMPTRHDFGIILGDVPIEVDARTHFSAVLRQVEAAQRNGFTYICIGQHFLYDAFRWLQPIPLLARLAAETAPDVCLVVSVLVTPFYHPVVLAEELATLDIVSDGRLIVGVGAGYRPREFELMGVPRAERFRRMEEGLRLMKAVWSQSSVTFEGEFWQLEDAPTHVQPLQQPHPPIWMGAMKEVGIRRAARIGDAWMITPETPFEEAARGMGVFDREREAQGLPLTRFPIRREIVLGADIEDALGAYRARSQSRYVAYAERGHALLGEQGVAEDFRNWALERVIAGSPEDCITQIERLDAARLGPIIVRPGWPGMETDAVVAYLDEVGERVVRPCRTA